jgi:hypothetical protein
MEKLYNEELHNLYTQLFKYIGLPHVGKMRSAYSLFSLETSKEEFTWEI